MQQSWCLAANSNNASAKQLTGYYGRRWGIECALRDTGSALRHVGMGTMRRSPGGATGTGLINAFAVDRCLTRWYG